MLWPSPVISTLAPVNTVGPSSVLKSKNANATFAALSTPPKSMFIPARTLVAPAGPVKITVLWRSLAAAACRKLEPANPTAFPDTPRCPGPAKAVAAPVARVNVPGPLSKISSHCAFAPIGEVDVPPGEPGTQAMSLASPVIPAIASKSAAADKGRLESSAAAIANSPNLKLETWRIDKDASPSLHISRTFAFMAFPRARYRAIFLRRNQANREKYSNSAWAWRLEKSREGARAG